MLRRLRRTFDAVIARARFERDMRDELRLHVEHRADDLVAAGQPRDDALRQARVEFGRMESYKEQCRDVRGFAVIRPLHGFAGDLRLAVRRLNADKAFAFVALATLALGIGVTTAVFSVTYGVLLRPLPYPDPGSLVRLSERHPGATPLSGLPLLSSLTYYAWNGHSRTLGPIATYGSRVRTVGLDEPVRMAGGSLSPSIVDVLRVAPALGRFFTDEDTRQGAAPVVILSDGLWRDRFGSNPNALQQSLSIDQTAHLIVGIAPAGFSFPDREARFWTPQSVLQPTAGGRVSAISAIARLRPGATADQAAAEGTAFARAQPRPPAVDLTWGKGAPVEVQVRTMVNAMTTTVRQALLLFLAGAGCLLLITCANVANLMLSRGASREREVAVRVALGASRARVIRLLLTESVVMAVVGGALGVALAAVIVRTLPAIAPENFPRLADVQFDWIAAAFGVAISLLACAMSGLMPAIRGGQLDVLPGLRDGAGASVGRPATLIRRLLVVAEASLAVMLLVIALLVGRSFLRLVQVNPGYDAGNVLTARVYLPGAALRPGEADIFAGALLQRLRAVPGVQFAGAGWMAPFARSTSASTFTIGAPGREPVTARSLVNVVTPGYAEALRLQLRAGRLLTDADLSSAQQSLVVNEQFVRTFLPGRDPVGLNVGVILSRGVEAEIVGVVRNVLKDGLHDQAQPEVYLVAAHRYTVGGEIKLVVRTQGDPLATAGTLRQLVRQLRTDAALDNVLPLSAQLTDSVRAERLATAALGAIALFSLILAAVGLYGVLSYNVSVRQRELGIRAALGASAREIAWLIVREGMSVTVVGLLIGLAAAAGVAHIIQSLLFGVSPLDAVTFIVAPGLLGAVAVVGCLLPGLRAAATDPVTALRAQ